MADDAGSKPSGALIIKFPVLQRMDERPNAADLVPLNFRVEPEFRTAFTDFCRRHQLGRREALMRAFDLLREEFEG